MRHYRFLRPSRRGNWPARSCSSCRLSERFKSDWSCGALPPRDRSRWRAYRLWRRNRAQTLASGARSRGVNDAAEAAGFVLDLRFALTPRNLSRSRSRLGTSPHLIPIRCVDHLPLRVAYSHYIFIGIESDHAALLSGGEMDYGPGRGVLSAPGLRSIYGCKK